MTLVLGASKTENANQDMQEYVFSSPKGENYGCVSVSCYAMHYHINVKYDDFIKSHEAVIGTHCCNSGTLLLFWKQILTAILEAYEIHIQFPEEPIKTLLKEQEDEI